MHKVCALTSAESDYGLERRFLFISIDADLLRPDSLLWRIRHNKKLDCKPAIQGTSIYPELRVYGTALLLVSLWAESLE